MPVQAVPVSQDQAPAKRASVDVQSDFNNLAFRAGHLQFEISCKEKDLKMFNDTLINLQIEYNTLKQQEDSVAKAVASAKAADESAKNEVKDGSA